MLTVSSVWLAFYIVTSKKVSHCQTSVLVNNTLFRQSLATVENILILLDIFGSFVQLLLTIILGLLSILLL